MLTAQDKELLNIIQYNLPLTPRPFKTVGELLGIEEDEVIAALQQLKNQGYIRRIGPFFDSEKMSYTGCLVATRIKPENLPTVAKIINQYKGITHNYQRSGKYNLWFTLITNNDDLRQKILAKLASLNGVEELFALPSTRKFKINVQFKL